MFNQIWILISVWTECGSVSVNLIWNYSIILLLPTITATFILLFININFCYILSALSRYCCPFLWSGGSESVSHLLHRGGISHWSRHHPDETKTQFLQVRLPHFYLNSGWWWTVWNWLINSVSLNKIRLLILNLLSFECITSLCLLCLFEGDFLH